MKRFYCFLLLCSVLISCTSTDKMSEEKVETPIQPPEEKKVETPIQPPEEKKVETPVEVIEVGIPHIARDVKIGSLFYEGKTVKVRGVVDEILRRDDGTPISIGLKTHVKYVTFYVGRDHFNAKAEQDLSIYHPGETYTFIVHIKEIREVGYGFESIVISGKLIKSE